jgi:hypothetical protein
VTFRERVLAAKAKIDEAADELLELVAQSPGAAADVMQILNPRAATVPAVESRDFFKSTLLQDGVEISSDEFELTPYSHGFERRKIVREESPDTLLVRAGVLMLVALYPEDEAESERLRERAREAGR